MGDAVATAFPWLVLLAVLGILILGFRLHRHLGQGSASAGPLHVDRGEPPGQERTPWELKAIEQQLRAVNNPNSTIVRRYDLTATINRLSASAGLDGPEYQLPITADQYELANAIARLEHRLGLPPLGEGSDR